MRFLRDGVVLTLVLAVALGGAIAGYSYSEYRLRVIVLNSAAEHQAEIRRLQETNTRVLAALTAQVQSAAQTANIAGARAANAADQSAVAAQTAKSAAVETARAAQRRPTIVVTPVVPEPARANLNRAIERTNRAIDHTNHQEHK
jgi:hypothetical protein